ncbi:MAG: DMT family transporter [Candidatus Rokubacteria bacterium]|nr:DMT family transporter [Candidatus Rokubacteria bacterium]
MRALLPHLVPASSGFWMVGLATLEMAIISRGRLDAGVLRRHWRFFLVVGLLVGVNTNLGFVAMRYVEPGTASLLSRTSILFGVGLGVLWLGERLTRVETAGAGVAIAGAIAISAQPGDHLRMGSLVVVIATLLYAVHSAVVKRFGGAIPFREFFFFRLASTSAVLLVLGAGQQQLVWPGRTAWLLLILAATVNVVFSRALYYLALRRLDMTFLTIVLTLTPVVTWLWSIPLFGGRPTGVEIAGGIAILAGVIIVSASRGGLLRPAVPVTAGPER